VHAGALYYFALAHQPDFDVRWCKGPIGSFIFDPLVQKLKTLGVQILPGRRVQEILSAGVQGAAAAGLNPAAAAAAFGKTLAGRVVAKGPQGVTETFDADAVVLAAGVPALQQMVRSSRLLGSAGEH
jgi:phytoene dehydrogenase-like protein